MRHVSTSKSESVSFERKDNRTLLFLHLQPNEFRVDKRLQLRLVQLR
jgi:hypothetical protein